MKSSQRFLSETTTNIKQLEFAYSKVETQVESTAVNLSSKINIDETHKPKTGNIEWPNLISMKKKRMRTSFKHQQLRIMKAYFQINQNPDSKELKELSERTGLSKRTLQVWFQNSRAKQRNIKKQTTNSQEKLERNGNRWDKKLKSNFDYQIEQEFDNDDFNNEEIDDEEINDDENNENLLAIEDNKELNTLSINSICLYNGVVQIGEDNSVETYYY